MTNKKDILPFKATHPGILIRDEIEVRNDLNQKDLAKELGVKASFLNEIIKGKRSITADLALVLEKCLEIPANYWMKFQSQYDIDKAKIKEKNINQLRNIEIWKIIKEYVPVRFFNKLGYLKNILEDDINIINQIYSVSNIDELVATFAENRFAYYRKSEKLQIDEKNLFAWSSLAIYEANIQEINTFNFDNIEQLHIELSKIFYININTIEEVKRRLNLYGIKLILIQKIDKVPVDGFSFWSGENPTIALTLRHSRIDNFAFTIIHEIAHISLHLRNNKDKRFMDLRRKENTSILEKEANDYAQRTLIPIDCLNDLRKLTSSSSEHIEQLGKKYEINPAILLGRLCYDSNNYAVKTSIDKMIH